MMLRMKIYSKISNAQSSSSRSNNKQKAPEFRFHDDNDDEHVNDGILIQVCASLKWDALKSRLRHCLLSVAFKEIVYGALSSPKLIGLETKIFAHKSCTKFGQVLSLHVRVHYRRETFADTSTIR